MASGKRFISTLVLHWILPSAILIAGVLSVSMLGSKPKPNRKRKPPRISIPVEVVNAKTHGGSLNISVTGTVVPYREIQLATEVGGKVIWKSEALLSGRYVKAGEELLKIDPTDYKLKVEQLQQQLAKADADLSRLQVESANVNRLVSIAQRTLSLRKREVQRMQSLSRSQASSEVEKDAAESRYLETSQALTTLENQLRTLKSDTTSLTTAKELAAIGLKQATLDFQKTVITAPVSGVVVRHSVEVNSHLMPGSSVATIEDTSKVEVRCQLRKEDLDFLPQPSKEIAGQEPDLSKAYQLPPVPVTVKYSRAGRRYSWHGELNRQDGLGMDQRTRTMPVRIRVDDPHDCDFDSAGGTVGPIVLMRGMFVQVDLHCEPQQPLLVIPEEAIRPGKNVWIADEGQLQIQPVRIVRIENGMAYVDSRGGQLSEKQAIISSPVPGAKAGLSVTTGRRDQSTNASHKESKRPQNPETTSRLNLRRLFRATINQHLRARLYPCFTFISKRETACWSGHRQEPQV